MRRVQIQRLTIADHREQRAGIQLGSRSAGEYPLAPANGTRQLARKADRDARPTTHSRVVEAAGPCSSFFRALASQWQEERRRCHHVERDDYTHYLTLNSGKSVSPRLAAPSRETM